MTNPASFLQHLRDAGYHPRSDKHSNALATAILDDLIRHCPRIREKAGHGETHCEPWLFAGSSCPPVQVRDTFPRGIRLG